MTHEEIVAAIERLRELPKKSIYTSTQVINAITDGPWVDDLIDLLEQADPDTHIALPVDAEGVPIHIGDEMEMGTKHRRVMTVIGVGTPGVHNSYAGVLAGVFVRDADCYTWYSARFLHHYHKPTVEGVLREFVNEWIEADSEGDVFAKYAAKLRELIADDDAR